MSVQSTNIVKMVIVKCHEQLPRCINSTRIFYQHLHTEFIFNISHLIQYSRDWEIALNKRSRPLYYSFHYGSFVIAIMILIAT